MAGLESAGLTIGNRGIWCARLDSNQHCTALEAAASTVGLRAHGRLGRIRTDTECGLSALPLPGPEGTPATSLLGGSQGFEPWMFPQGLPSLQPGAFSLSANCPNANCQRSAMPRGSWFSRISVITITRAFRVKTANGFIGKLQT
jgi:hypothetical protein